MHKDALSLIGLAVVLCWSCQQPSKTTGDCTLIHAQANTCTWTAWDYEAYQVKIREARRNSDGQLIYRRIDSTWKAPTLKALQTIHRSEWLLDSMDQVDSTWTVRVDSLNGAIPWRRYEERYSKAKGGTYQLILRSSIAYHSTDQKSYTSYYANYTNNLLRDSIIYYPLGDSMIHKRYDRNRQLEVRSSSPLFSN